MQRMRRATVAALAILLLSGLSQARTLDQVPSYLQKEGGFVTHPARAFGYLGMAVGTVVALPAVAIAAPVGWAAGDPLGYAMVPVSVLATGAGEAGYHVGGAIPWALKKGFYDAPMAGIARVRGIAPSGMVADLEPPAPDLTDLQYLASTPPDARVPATDDRRVSVALPPPPEATSLMLLKRKVSPFKPPPGSVPAPASARVHVPAAAGATPVAPAVRPAPAAQVVRPAPVTAAAAPALEAPASPEPKISKRAAEPAKSVEPVVEGEESYERPSLRKKKPRFSERFRF